MYERYGEHYWIARSSRCFPMNCLSLNIQGIGSKAKKEWVREINIKHKVNLLTLQETKMDSISAMDVKLLCDNYNFDHVFSEVIGNSGGILCTWDSNVFHKEQHIISDNFFALYGTWNPNKAKLLMISIYTPQSATGKRSLWSYITSFITRWNGDCMVFSDFNEVRCMEDRMGSVFKVQRANEFNNFISNSELVKVQLEGYSFTWSHLSATKMSKLDRFLVTEGLVSLFPHILGICLDRHLSDHRPILLREVITDYGATPFRMYHSWFSLHGFEQMVTHTWNFIVLDDRNEMVCFKKKMQFLKKEIRVWVMDQKQKQSGRIKEVKSKLSDIDKLLDQGGVNDEILLSRMDLLKQIQDSKSSDARDCVMVDGEWMDDPSRVKEEFRSYFTTRFQAPGVDRSRDEIRNAVWAFRENKSLGPDGFTFEFFWIFTGIKIDSSLTISHLFYADDVVFIGEWSNANLTGSTPIYNMSLYKVPKSVLHLMESIRRNFFNGIQGDERKITWVKWSKGYVPLSFRRTVRGGVKAHQLDLLQNLIGLTILTNLEDRWVWDLNGEGVFRVKDLHNLLDESFFPKDSTTTRWVKSIPIKINVFAWKVYLDRLPT
nr:RNA-directed DNA polymerase, eukaryota [Tanacetum cinerariifolium]